MVCSEESQASTSVRKESCCELFKHVGVFDLRTEGQGSAGVTKCIDDDG